MATAYFLRKEDYSDLIRETNLDVISEDSAILRQSELRAQSEIESYMRHRYDVSLVFAPLQDWNENTVFKWGNRVYLTAPAYSTSATYVTNDRVIHDGKVYFSTAGSSPGAFNVLQWTLIADQGHYYMDTVPWNKAASFTTGDTAKVVDKCTRKFFIALQNSTEKDPMSEENSSYWQEIESQSGELLAANQYWQVGDSRDQFMVGIYIDITLYHLHSRINPRNIPDLRMQRRDEAISWLKMNNEGKITSALPLIIPEQGNNVVFGYSKGRVNNFY